MPRYLLDTNILLRSSDPNSLSYQLASECVDRLISQGNPCVIISQVLIEFWVVATRPLEVNGLGWTTERTHTKIAQIISQFELLPETDEIFTTWLDLVTSYQIMGKRTHDLRLIE